MHFSATADLETAPSTSSTADSDEQLMARMKAGDETALETFQQRHRALVRTIIARVINNDTDAEELVVEVMLEAWKQSANYDEEKGKALGWLVTLARRRAIDRLRKKQTYQRAQDRLQEYTEREPLVGHVENDASDNSDRAEILQAVIATLPEAQQRVINLAFFRGMSQREIAAHTATPLGTVKTRLELAIKKVRTMVMAKGGRAEWGFAASNS